VKDSGPPRCLRHVDVTAATLPGPANWKAASGADASRAPGRWEDNTAPSRGPEGKRDGADGRALGIAAADVSGKAKTARPWLNSARRRASR
jgi:hypothetical protein